MSARGLPNLLNLACCLAAAAVWTHSAGAASFPHQPVRIVIPFPVSGPTDIRGTSRMTKSYKLIAEHAPPSISDALARLVAQAIRADAPRGVILERQPGAITTRGAASVARSPADGHTLLLASNGTIVINPEFLRDVGYAPMRDFVLVAPLATMPFVLLVSRRLPVENANGLVAWLKMRPGEVNYGSSGGGTTGHLAAELFRRMTGVNVVHVSYNGGFAALTGLALNHVSFMFAALPLALPYAGSDHVRVLAVAGRERAVALPELPTLSESGVPGVEAEGWYAMFAPAQSPPRAVAWLAERISLAIDDPVTQMHLLTLGLEPITRQRGQFATRILSESERWAPLIRASRPFARASAS